MNTIIKKVTERVLTVGGCMTFIKWANGQHTADFESDDKVDMEDFTAICKVQAMRDGNVYITQLPKRIRNKALFRDDNCTFTLGRDGRYYFVFTMPKHMVNKLPVQLIRQAAAIAQKVIRELINDNHK